MAKNDPLTPKEIDFILGAWNVHWDLKAPRLPSDWLFYAEEIGSLREKGFIRPKRYSCIGREGELISSYLWVLTKKGLALNNLAIDRPRTRPRTL